MKRFLRFFVVIAFFFFFFGSLNVNAEDNNNAIASEEPTINEAEDPNETDEEEYEEYNLNRMAAVIINKLDDDGNYLPGAVLQVLDSEGLLIAEWTSTDDSFAILLPDGTYTLHEVSASVL